MVVDNIIVSKDELMSVLLGYDVDTGWRSQNDVVISVPYKQWVQFNSENKGLRINVKDLSERSFMRDISLAQYNELLYSSYIKKDATLILPVSDNEVTYTDTLFEFADSLSGDELYSAYENIVIGLRNYFRCVDVDMNINPRVNERMLSPWNKRIYHTALSYQLFDEALNIIWR